MIGSLLLSQADRAMNEDVWDDDEDGSENDDEESTIPCPYCRRPIYEESQRCPYCGSYISAEDAAPTRKRWWIIVGVVLALYVIYRWIVG
jgi:hypothetical protein